MDVGAPRPSRADRHAVPVHRLSAADPVLLALPLATRRTPQPPYFASADVNEAYATRRPRSNLDKPTIRASSCAWTTESHNCWGRRLRRRAPAGHAGGDPGLRQRHCAHAGRSDPGDLQGADACTTVPSPRATTATTTSQIAKCEFKTGTGTIAYDTSGVEPALDLTSPATTAGSAAGAWVVAPGSKAQGTTTASAKLYDMILRPASTTRCRRWSA